MSEDNVHQSVERVLEAQGLYCPEPVMMLHAAVAEMNSGELLKVIATDPSTKRDIPKFCQFLGHTLEEQERVERRVHLCHSRGLKMATPVWIICSSY